MTEITALLLSNSPLLSSVLLTGPNVTPLYGGLCDTLENAIYIKIASYPTCIIRTFYPSNKAKPYREVLCSSSTSSGGKILKIPLLVGGLFRYTFTLKPFGD